MSAPHWLLVVDDDPRIGDILTLSCPEEYRVHWVPNVAATLRSLDAAEKPPEAIVMDLCMPEADGFDLMRGLAGRSASVPLIIISGQDANYIAVAQEFARIWGLPVAAALRKPFDLIKLFAAVDGCAARSERAADRSVRLNGTATNDA